MNMYAKRKMAFTMIEVLIVVVIIGILAGVAIPRYTSRNEHAAVAEVVNMLGAMHRGGVTYFNKHGNWGIGFNDNLGRDADAAGWAQLGMKPPYTDVDLNERAAHIKWVYKYEGNDAESLIKIGKSWGRRVNVSDTDPRYQKWVGLYETGSWIGNGPYVRGGQYLPEN